MAECQHGEPKPRGKTKCGRVCHEARPPALFWGAGMGWHGRWADGAGEHAGKTQCGAMANAVHCVVRWSALPVAEGQQAGW